jgi:hypothetical protein
VDRDTGGSSHFLVGEFNADEAVKLRLYAFSPSAGEVTRVIVRLLDNSEFPSMVGAVTEALPAMLGEERALMERLKLESSPELESRLREQAKSWLADGRTAVLFFAPRGLGMDTWNPPAKYEMDLPRRFQLLGQTVEGMRVWDILALTEAIRSVGATASADIELHASGAQAVNAAYAALMGAQVERLVLTDVPVSHRTGPDYLNVLKLLDVPEALALCGSFTAVEWSGAEKSAWSFPHAVAAKLGWPAEKFRFRE